MQNILLKFVLFFYISELIFSIVGNLNLISRVRGDSWHTFHIIIFRIFSVLVKLNVTARMASNTLGLQSDLHKFDAIRKEWEGEAVALISARVPT
jgi:hypothetical protein